jgi:putative FmdB family regulatory protein
MPIYEYHTKEITRACPKCRRPFEALQGIREKPITKCPECGRAVKRVISWCRSAVVETPENAVWVKRKVKQYEEAGMWSHAAEFADKHSEKTKDKDLKMRALDNYKKAGYDADSLAKHANLDND